MVLLVGVDAGQVPGFVVPGPRTAPLQDRFHPSLGDPRGDLGARAEPELAQDLYVALHRTQRDRQCRSDFTVGHTSSYQFGHLELPRSERCTGLRLALTRQEVILGVADGVLPCEGRPPRDVPLELPSAQHTPCRDHPSVTARGERAHRGRRHPGLAPHTLRSPQEDRSPDRIVVGQRGPRQHLKQKGDPEPVTGRDLRAQPLTGETQGVEV